jgi:hypothetical protein
MAFSREGRGRRQVETVRTGMGFGQIAVLRDTRVDLDYFDYVRKLTAPSQPPPLVTALRCGDECDVTAVVSGQELAAEGTSVRYGILGDRGQPQQLGGADGEHGAAASLLVPRPGGTRHIATVPERCDFDTGPNGSVCVTKGLAQRLVVAAALLGGRRVGIRGHDADLLRPGDPAVAATRPKPWQKARWPRLRGLRPAGPPTASPDPVRVQRRVSDTGVVITARQTVALGRSHAGNTVTIDVTDTELVVGCDDAPRTVRPDEHAADPEPESQPAPQGRAVKPKPTVKRQLGRHPSSVKWD